MLFDTLFASLAVCKEDVLQVSVGGVAQEIDPQTLLELTAVAKEVGKERPQTAFLLNRVAPCCVGSFGQHHKAKRGRGSLF